VGEKVKDKLATFGGKFIILIYFPCYSLRLTLSS